MTIISLLRPKLFLCISFIAPTTTNIFAINQKTSVILVGAGRVGQALEKKLHTDSDFVLRASFTSKTYKIFNAAGNLEAEAAALNNSQIMAKETELVSNTPLPFVLIDTSSNFETFELLKITLARGGYVATANKKHFSQEQQKFDLLHALGQERLFYNTTVGAGLPIIKTIKELIAKGNQITSIKGIFSGTLGFIFSELDKPIPFAAAVTDAYNRGFTEPHPKDDLSGMDVARKILILARILGTKMELEKINIFPLYPSDMEKLNAKDFMQTLSTKETSFTQLVVDKQKIRYLGSIIKTDKGYTLQTAIEAVGQTSPFFTAAGPENVIVIDVSGQPTPYIIRGAGAGIDVTAEKLYEDLCAIKNNIKSQVVH